MLISRILTSITLKYQNRFVLKNSRCFLSSTISSEKQINVLNSSNSISDKSPNENNEWLWAYLRNQKSFSDLNEEQRRRVIEIGKEKKTD